jgi:hypothetical protein
MKCARRSIWDVIDRNQFRIRDDLIRTKYVASPQGLETSTHQVVSRTGNKDGTSLNRFCNCTNHRYLGVKVAPVTTVGPDASPIRPDIGEEYRYTHFRRAPVDRDI